jgi:hypothetical protein
MTGRCVGIAKLQKRPEVDLEVSVIDLDDLSVTDYGYHV